jgi:prepilin-type processing-associated H-X9-DG protein
MTITKFKVCRPSYVGVAGAVNGDDLTTSPVNVCCSPTPNGEISGGGILVPNSSVSIRDIHDGTSMTISVSECSDFSLEPSGMKRNVDGGFPNGWLSGTIGLGTPPLFRSNSSSAKAISPPVWNLTTIRYPINSKEYLRPGIEENHGPNHPLLSAHPKGVHALYVDGSVRLHPDNLELAVLRKLATRSDGLVSTF